jgi:hypothetical protein
LVKTSVHGKLGLDTLYAGCKTIESKNPTFYQYALSITDTPEKNIECVNYYDILIHGDK